MSDKVSKLEDFLEKSSANECTCCFWLIVVCNVLFLIGLCFSIGGVFMDQGDFYHGEALTCEPFKFCNFEIVQTSQWKNATALHIMLNVYNGDRLVIPKYDFYATYETGDLAREHCERLTEGKKVTCYLFEDQTVDIQRRPKSFEEITRRTNGCNGRSLIMTFIAIGIFVVHCICAYEIIDTKDKEIKRFVDSLRVVSKKV